jgi:hypothetical protein
VPLFIGPILLLVAALAIHSAYARRHDDTPPDQGNPQ